MRGRTYSAPLFKTWTMPLEKSRFFFQNPKFFPHLDKSRLFKIPNFSHIWTNPGYSKSQIFPTFGQIPVIQNPKFFPHLDKSRLFKIPNFSHIWTNPGYSKSQIFPTFGQIPVIQNPKFFPKLVHFISTCLSYCCILQGTAFQDIVYHFALQDAFGRL